MPCFRPLKGYAARDVNPSGKRSTVFSPRLAVDLGHPEYFREHPCGQCKYCRKKRAREWAIRCMHEASLHEQNCFITLTYADEHLPYGGTLVLEHFQLFMGRLRDRIGYGKVRVYYCGEYGARFQRPHYHACLFGFDFPDKRFWKKKHGNIYYTSELLQELWPSGFSTVGALTFESAAYTARYITKKITGDAAPDHYRKPILAPDGTWKGEYVDLLPEFNKMSLKPGIAKPWLEKHMPDVYPSDEVVFGGKKFRPPKYYDRHFELVSPKEFATLKASRRRQALKFTEQLHSLSLRDFERGRVRDRLSDLEVIEELKHQREKREYENAP